MLALSMCALPVKGAAARPVREVQEVAQEWPPEPSHRMVQRGGGVSLQEAVRLASSRYPGRVVRAITTDKGGRRVHEIRILLAEGGRVVTVRVDAQTGEIR